MLNRNIASVTVAFWFALSPALADSDKEEHMVANVSSGAKVVADAKAAAEWISKVLSGSGYRADFTLQSLKEIDRFFDEQSPGGVAKPGGLLSQQLGTRIFAIGGYVGEVVRRKAGGTWQGDDHDARAEMDIYIQLKSGTVFWPIQRVMKRLKNGPEDSLYAYGEVLAIEAQQYPPKP
jgi:hypothetical protein